MTPRLITRQKEEMSYYKYCRLRSERKRPGKPKHAPLPENVVRLRERK